MPTATAEALAALQRIEARVAIEITAKLARPVRRSVVTASSQGE